MTGVAGVPDVSERSAPPRRADGEGKFTVEEAREPAWSHDNSQQQRMLLLFHAEESLSQSPHRSHSK